MSAISTIEWTDRTWNPVRGCEIVSPGCVNCYAMKQAHRFSGPGKPYEGLTKLTERSGPQWTGMVRTVDAALLEPLSWRRPQKVFVNSMSDLFHDGVPDEFIDKVFAVMALATRHTFQVLTKRPDRMRNYLLGVTSERLYQACRTDDEVQRVVFDAAWPLPNVWLGVSVEDQQRADERIPLLAQTPAAVRFISAEPLLRAVDLRFDGVLTEFSRPHWPVHWVIAGGESGPHARPCAIEWIWSLMQQCKAAGVPVFVKQLGAYVVSEGRAADTPEQMREILGADAKWPDHRWFWRAGLTDKKGADVTQWPEYLSVREFPRVAEYV